MAGDIVDGHPVARNTADLDTLRRERARRGRASTTREQPTRGRRQRLLRHHERLFRAACVLCGSREDAEDLVVETYANISNRPSFARRDELGYLLLTLRKTMRKPDRAKAARHDTPPWDDCVEFVVDAEDLDVSSAEIRAAYRAVHHLPEALRDTLVAVDIVGLTYKQAARALETHEATIIELLQPAREQVAEQMESAKQDPAPPPTNNVVNLADKRRAVQKRRMLIRNFSPAAHE
jgi:RNA polymerase sigma-70 factor (ECF subfamily)